MQTADMSAGGFRSSAEFPIAGCTPWTAPPEVLRDARVRLGAEYPRPIVNHDVARKRALEALGSVVASRAAEGD